jgi:hypothetical protein
MALVEAERHIDMNAPSLALIAPGAPRQGDQRLIRAEGNYGIRNLHLTRMHASRRHASEIHMHCADASKGKQVLYVSPGLMRTNMEQMSLGIQLRSEVEHWCRSKMSISASPTRPSEQRPQLLKIER